MIEKPQFLQALRHSDDFVTERKGLGLEKETGQHLEKANSINSCDAIVENYLAFLTHWKLWDWLHGKLYEDMKSQRRIGYISWTTGKQMERCRAVDGVSELFRANAQLRYSVHASMI